MNPDGAREGLIARFREGPALLERSLAGLEDAELDAAPPTGGWTIRQIVHHIADGDDLWKAGIKAALGNAPGEFTLRWYWTKPQEAWAEAWAYALRPVDVSLALLKASRAHVAQLLEQIPDAWGRSVGVLRPDGEIVRFTVEAIVVMQADHLEHHLGRIAAILSERSRTNGSAG